eukprot:4302154-Prymnesium_polylepis.1
MRLRCAGAAWALGPRRPPVGLAGSARGAWSARERLRTRLDCAPCLRCAREGSNVRATTRLPLHPPNPIPPRHLHHQHPVGARATHFSCVRALAPPGLRTRNPSRLIHLVRREW